MDEQMQEDLLEPTYSSSVLIQDVDLKSCRKQWTIEKGDEKGSRISVLIERHEDHEDLSDNSFSQGLKTLLSILIDYNNAVVWEV